MISFGTDVTIGTSVFSLDCDVGSTTVIFGTDVGTTTSLLSFDSCSGTVSFGTDSFPVLSFPGWTSSVLPILLLISVKADFRAKSKRVARMPTNDAIRRLR